MACALYFYRTFNIGFIMHGGDHSHRLTPLVPHGTSINIGFTGRAYTVPWTLTTPQHRPGIGVLNAPWSKSLAPVWGKGLVSTNATNRTQGERTLLPLCVTYLSSGLRECREYLVSPRNKNITRDLEPRKSDKECVNLRLRCYTDGLEKSLEALPVGTLAPAAA